jgi:cholest-4-en-3-one 26-monooxygenase
MLATAGNETTRNAIAFGMNEFLTRPDQWELYVRTRPASAADEIVRWSTPIQVFQRTATRDTELDGVKIAEGERVGLFYGSANYDEEVFERPFEFDITRSPNPHLGFGGSGAHYCIGANLARMEINLMFNAIADLAPGIRKDGELQRVRSGWVNGAKHLPVRYQSA